jgi:hypothetical protein
MLWGMRLVDVAGKTYAVDTAPLSYATLYRHVHRLLVTLRPSILSASSAWLKPASTGSFLLDSVV